VRPCTTVGSARNIDSNLLYSPRVQTVPVCVRITFVFLSSYSHVYIRRRGTAVVVSERVFTRYSRASARGGDRWRFACVRGAAAAGRRQNRCTQPSAVPKPFLSRLVSPAAVVVVTQFSSPLPDTSARRRRFRYIDTPPIFTAVFPFAAAAATIRPRIRSKVVVTPLRGIVRYTQYRQYVREFVVLFYTKWPGITGS